MHFGVHTYRRYRDAQEDIQFLVGKEWICMSRGKYKRKRIRRQRKMEFICATDLPKRIITILENAGINTIADLDERTDEELLAINGIGKKAMEEIRLLKDI